MFFDYIKLKNENRLLRESLNAPDPVHNFHTQSEIQKLHRLIATLIAGGVFWEIIKHI